MAKKQHRPEEIVAKLRQVEVLTAQGGTVAEGARAIGVTEATYYHFLAEYGGRSLDQVKRLKLLEQENGRLRKAVAERMLGQHRSTQRKAPTTPDDEAALTTAIICRTQHVEGLGVAELAGSREIQPRNLRCRFH